MMIENILKILKPNSMRRIDDIHILDIYIGLGQNAMPIVVVRSMIDIKLPKSSKNIEIIDNYKENEHSYYFCLMIYLVSNSPISVQIELFVL